MREVLSARLSRARTVLLPIVLAGLLWPHLCAAQAVFPAANGQALAGVRSFNARAYASGWMDVETDVRPFVNSLDRAFQLGLRRDGVTVDSAAPNYLDCRVTATQTSSGIIAYAWVVRYYDKEATGLHLLLWETEGLATVGVNNFRAEDAAKQCVDAFALEWLKWNPRRAP